MSMAPVISATGIVAPTFADILVYLQSLFYTIYGADTYLDPDSQDGQWLTVLATLINDANNATIAAYNSYSPNNAQGTGLSTAVKINGIRRNVSSNSQVPVDITGTVGFTILGGQVSDANGNNIWNLPDSVEIPESATITVTATAVNPGAIIAPVDSINTIVNPQRGWLSVNNSVQGTPGAPVEEDGALRIRQAQSTAIPALSVVNAIQGAIANLIGVSRVVVYENDTGATDANGVPAHSICVVVEGGDVVSVAQLIAQYKTPGTGTYGDISENVTNGVAPPITIKFQELALITVSELLVIGALTGYSSNTGVLIQAASAAWLSDLAIGEDSYLGRLYSPANLSGDAATGATGLSQSILDGYSNTYNVKSIYQARSDMAVIGGPYAAGTHVINITNADSVEAGQLCAATLDDGTILYTSINGAPAGTAVTLTAAIPGGRTIQNGGLLYIQGDLTIGFDEATISAPANVKLAVS